MFIIICIINVGVPRILRSDCGTENTHIAFLQPFLRRNHADCFSGSASFRYGKSVSNQVRAEDYDVNAYQNNILYYNSVSRLGGLSSRGGAPNGGTIFST